MSHNDDPLKIDGSQNQVLWWTASQKQNPLNAHLREIPFRKNHYWENFRKRIA